MLHRVDLTPMPLEPYEPIVGAAVVERLRGLAERLRGVRIVHINATPYGGGVSELLRSEVALLLGLGLDVEWQVIAGDTRFFEVTKGMHNALQGGRFTLAPEAREIYLHNNAANASRLDGGYDVYVVHDPQPAAMRFFKGDAGGRWIWRCHIDTSEPNPEVAEFLVPYLEPYDAYIFTMASFVLPQLPHDHLRIIPPGIDPLSPKNIALPADVCERIVTWHGVDLRRPLLLQVSRFDPWKDPFGVLRVYRAAREVAPGLQLALLGSMAHDDPEGWHLYEQIRAEAAADPDIHVGSNLTGISSVEVNAFQHCADVAIQKSIREGFGLVVSETLWKETPIVAGRTGGIVIQVPERAHTLLVDPLDEPAFIDRVRTLLHDREEARRLARAGKEHVRQRFLITRMIEEELTFVSSLLGISGARDASTLPGG